METKSASVRIPKKTKPALNGVKDPPKKFYTKNGKRRLHTIKNESAAPGPAFDLITYPDFIFRKSKPAWRGVKHEKYYYTSRGKKIKFKDA